MKPLTEKTLLVYTPVRVYKHIDSIQNILGFYPYTFDFKNQKVIKENEEFSFKHKHIAKHIYLDFVVKLKEIAKDDSLKASLAKDYLAKQINIKEVKTNEK